MPGRVPMDKWLLDGVLAETLDINDRGLQYGDGLFETIAVRDGNGRFMDSHLERLHKDSARLGIECPSAELLRQDLAQLIPAEGNGVAKIILTRGSGRRGYAPPMGSRVRRLVGFAAGGPTSFPVAGVKTCFCSTRVAISPALAGIKSLNRLEQVLARAELQASGCDEGIMLDAHDRVVCGTMTNLFVVRGDTLFTPDLTHAGVCGIMRAQVMNVAADAGIVISEGQITPADLRSAQALFLTNALIGLWPVAQLEEISYRTDHALLERIREGLVALGVTECSG